MAYEKKGLHFQRRNATFGVNIGNNVTIHSGTNIVKGLTQDTVICDWVKIGQRVVVGHDSYIGEGSMIMVSSTIAGHVTIGKGCYIGTGAVIKNRVKIGDGSLIGAGSVVIKDIPPNTVAYNINDDLQPVYCRPVKKVRGELKNWVRTHLI